MKLVLKTSLLLCLALAIGSCGERSASLRYKLTLSLDTPDGVKTGYNVVELRWDAVSLPMQGTMHYIHGQGVYVDLGPGRRPLIALLERIRRPEDTCPPKPGGHNSCEDPTWENGVPGPLMAKAFKASGEKGADTVVGYIEQLAHLPHTPFPLTTREIPDLVTFANINDPTSVISVDPDNLTATLGPGVSWRSITAEMTSEPLSNGIEPHLPWAKTYNNAFPLPGVKDFNEKDAFISRGDFIVDGQL